MQTLLLPSKYNLNITSMKKITTLFMSLVLISHHSYSQQSVWTSKGIGGGGALFSPGIHQANTNEYYIACDMGELFHTTNFGTSYSQAHFQQFVGGHNSRMCYTSTANLLYSIRYLGDVATPCKSTDNGATWTT